MRLIRLGALFGSLVLLVATMVSLFDTRSELRSDREDGVDVVAAVTAGSVVSTVERALAVVGAATVDTPPASLTSSFGNATQGCVGEGSDSPCTASGFQSVAVFGDAVRRSVDLGGVPVAVVDRASDTVIVVARSGGTTIGLRLVVDQLVGDNGLVPTAPASLQVSVDAAAPAPEGMTTTTSGGIRTSTIVVTEPFQAGAIEVSARADVAVGVGAGAPILYVSLIALGTILLALAGWTFIHERRTLEERATTDELTGLANRREFETLSEELLAAAERSNSSACVMLLDLNGFKQINDTRGHQVGDRVLQGCGERLRSAVRETDLVGRWGGDEFVILLPGVVDGTSVRIAADRIAAELSSTPVVDDIRVTASIGAAMFPRHGGNLDELIRAADLAMYSAKTSGVTHRMADPLTVAAAIEGTTGKAGEFDGIDRRRPRPS